MEKQLILLIPMSDFGVILSKDDRYLVIFGGKGRKGAIDSIYVSAINEKKNMKWRESKIKCPYLGEVYTVKIDDEQYGELLLYGYIRQYLGIKYPRNDIMGILKNWYCQEWVHLFCVSRKDWNDYSAKHCTINLNDILPFL